MQTRNVEGDAGNSDEMEGRCPKKQKVNTEEEVDVSTTGKAHNFEVHFLDQLCYSSR